MSTHSPGVLLDRRVLTSAQSVEDPAEIREGVTRLGASVHTGYMTLPAGQHRGLGRQHYRSTWPEFGDAHAERRLAGVRIAADGQYHRAEPIAQRGQMRDEQIRHFATSDAPHPHDRL